MIKLFEEYKRELKVGDWIIDTQDDFGEIIETDNGLCVRFVGLDPIRYKNRDTYTYW